jgi:hypothetical protein
VPNENVIRDKLAKSLTLLEPGLTLIETNHPLPNKAGSKGFVDILARDRRGKTVVIELKRSDQAAREAMHEILKYMRLFMEHHGAEAHEIRCFVVSTTWRELLIPFSEFRRRCEAQTEGFEIVVDSKGRVMRAKRVTDHALDQASLFYHHGVIGFMTSAERKKAKPLILDSLSQKGAAGHLLFHLDYEGKSKAVIYPFATYIVPTKIEPKVVKSLQKEALKDLAEAEIEQQRYREQLLLARVIRSVLPRIRELNYDVEIGYPEKFTQMVERDWSVKSLERSGPFADKKVTPEATLIDLVKGIGGMNVFRFERLTSPSQKLDWAQARAASAHCLEGNHVWTAGYNWFLDRIETTYPEGDVLARIYNPQMLPETIYRIVSERELAYMPAINLTVSQDGVDKEALIGGVTWDEKTIPKSHQDVFARIKDGVSGYYFALFLHDAAHFDSILMKRHGLSYSLWRATFDDNGGEVTSRIVISRDGKVRERKATPKPAMLPDFLIATPDYVVDLMNEIEQHVGRQLEVREHASEDGAG